MWCPDSCLTALAVLTSGAGVADASAALLALADDCGLGHLRAVALDYIVTHYDTVSRTGVHACGGVGFVGLPASAAGLGLLQQ